MLRFVTLRRAALATLTCGSLLAAAPQHACARSVVRLYSKLRPAELAAAKRGLAPMKSLKVLAKHSFGLHAPGRGRVIFAPVSDSSGRGSLRLVLMTRRGRVIQRVNYCGDRHAFDSLSGVGFVDVDGDGFLDVIAIAKVMTGMGPTGARPFSSAAVYLWRGRGSAGKLVPAKKLDSLCDGSKLRTVKAVARAAKRKLEK